MCGIAGTLGIPRPLAVEALVAMRDSLRHRGPDGEGLTFVQSPGHAVDAGLVHTRLAIIETSDAGRQPMIDEPTGNAITFNGEIYNYRELQKELAEIGAPCRSRTDTEVILKAYAKFGPDAAHQLCGMFAFCILDKGRGLAWLCRDRLGIKPLYVARAKSGGVLFASEARALIAVSNALIEKRASPQAIESFLAQGMVCGLDSLVEGIALVAPGESLLLDWNGKEQRRWGYWELPSSSARRATSRRDAVDRLATTLRDATRQHLLADVPLGVFLSSGVDSTAVATIASEVHPETLHTIAIGFDQKRFDETAGAEENARALATRHVTRRLRGTDMLSDIDQVLSAMDQPTIDGFNTYFVSRAARSSGLKVALSGVGGDELFGGYASFRDVPRARMLGRIVATMRLQGGLGRTARLMGRVAGRWGRSTAKLEELPRRPADLVRMYLLRRELLLPTERRALMPNPLGSDPYCGLGERVIAMLAEPLPSDAANAIASLEVRSYMRDMLLRDADVFSMAAGLELRVPLLDHRFVEAAFALPGRWKRPDPRAKPLLVDAVGARLPSGVALRPKRGFTFPWDVWLRGPLREKVGRVIHAAEVWQDLGIQSSAVAHLWKRFLRHDPRCGAPQMLALWVLAEFSARHRLRVR